MRAPFALLAVSVLLAGCFGAPDAGLGPGATATAPSNGTGSGSGNSNGSAPPAGAGGGAGPVVVTDPPCAFDGTGCATTPGGERGHVVVAVIDSGINPYHADFAAPLLAPAAQRIPGFPAGATPLHLSLGQPYADAAKADAAQWQAIEEGRLYTIPGTRIIGAITMGGLGTLEAPSTSLVLDDVGHGTGTASAVVRASPHADVVMVQVGAATLADGILWAAEQPWIDVVSVSWGTIGNVPVTFFTGVPEATKAAADAGKLVVVAAGNEPTPATTGYGGPAWVVAVGGSSPEGRGETWAASKGVDVVSDYSPVLATHDSADGEREMYGTSFGTPTVAAALAEAWWLAREAGHDVDAAALRAAMNAVATELGPADYAANTMEVPMVPTCVQQGWGYVDGSHAGPIHAVASGAESAPARALTQACMDGVYAARATLWG